MAEATYSWQTTYPTLATIMEANFETLATWMEKLPAPGNDVERTVARRLRVRYQELGLQQLRAQAPNIADHLEQLHQKIRRMGIRL